MPHSAPHPEPADEHSEAAAGDQWHEQTPVVLPTPKGDAQRTQDGDSRVRLIDPRGAAERVSRPPGENRPAAEPAAGVVPPSRAEKPRPDVVVIADARISNMPSREAGGDVPMRSRKPVKLEVNDVSRKVKSPWRIHLPEFRLLSKTTVALADALRIHRDPELSDWKKPMRIHWFWMIVVVMTILMAISGGYVLTYGMPRWVKVHILGREIKPVRPYVPKRDVAEDLIGGLQLPREQMKRFVKDVEQLLNSRAEAEKHFADYASLTVSEDILYFIRRHDGIEQRVREAGPPALVPKGWKPGTLCEWNVRTTSVSPYAVLNGSLPDGESYNAYFLIENGQLVMDWMATTAFGTATFAQLADGHGDSSEIRGWIVPDTYFNGVFREGDYHCYRLISPNKEDMVWCYTKVGSPISDEMAHFIVGGRVVRNPGAVSKVTVRLQRGPDGSMPNQWMIEQLVSDDWLKL